MKKATLVLTLLAISLTGMAQRQKVRVGEDGEMTVNNQTIAYIERVGCKVLSSNCEFYITNANDTMLITATMQSFKDRSQRSQQFPEGQTVSYLTFSFNGFDSTAEIEIPGLSVKTETVAKLIAQWRLINNGRLNPDGVNQFITHYGNRFSERERLQHQAPAIQIAR